MGDTHNSYDLLSHLTLLQNSGNKEIELGYLLGDQNHSYITIEPIITSLQKIDNIDISFHFDGDKTLSAEATDKSVMLTFTLTFQ
jgi:hypothetical protein